MDTTCPGLEKVDGIFFDAGDTLFRVKGSVGAIYAEVASRFGIQADPALLQGRFLAAWKEMPPLAFPGAVREERLALERKWWRRLVRKVLDEFAAGDFDRFFEEVYSIFEGEAGWELFPETRRVLEHLSERGYRLGIVSNFDSRIFKICEKLRIRGLFEAIVISSDAGVPKPHQGIFRSALDRFSLAAEEAAYIGNSPAHDLEGARAVGMLPILIDRSGSHPHGEGIRLPNLEPLLELFKKKAAPKEPPR
jgi:putative hydrolase of the HAD superfamily